MRYQRMGIVAAASLGVISLGVSGCGDSKGKQRTPEVATQVQVRPASAESAVPAEPRPVPITGPVSFKDAETAYMSREYGEAVTLFTSYTTQKPENPWGHYMLGLSAWKNKDYDQAEGELLKTLELDPSHVKSRFNLARVYLEKGEKDKAAEQVEQALQLDSTNPEAFRLLGRVREEQGQDSAAVEAYRQALKLDTLDAWTMNNLAMNFLKQGRPGEAIGAIARAVELKPDNTTFQNNLGMVLELNGYFVEAAKAYQAAIEKDSTNEKALENLTRITSRENRPGLAELNLETLSQNFGGEITVSP